MKDGDIFINQDNTEIIFQIQNQRFRAELDGAHNIKIRNIGSKSSDEFVMMTLPMDVISALNNMGITPLHSNQGAYDV